MKVPDLFVGKRFFVGEGKPEILGRGDTEVRGSGYIEGPLIAGNPKDFIKPIPTDLATVMISETENKEMKPIPFYQLFVNGFARIKQWLKIDRLLSVRYIKSQYVVTEYLFARSKNFKIDHPSDSNKYLIYSCLEGPEYGVYFRGRITGKTTIELPEVWKDLIDPDSITVQLQPVGAHQNIIVKGISDNKIYIQSNISLPIDCYYHVYAERKDIEKLVTEVNKNGTPI